MVDSRLVWKVQGIVQGGVLGGTILEPALAFIAVQYPHRKTKDLYVPPLRKRSKTWHCCQPDCSEPDFKTKDLLSHLEKHAGRLLKIKRKEMPEGDSDG